MRKNLELINTSWSEICEIIESRFSQRMYDISVDIFEKQRRRPIFVSYESNLDEPHGNPVDPKHFHDVLVSYEMLPTFWAFDQGAEEESGSFDRDIIHDWRRLYPEGRFIEVELDGSWDAQRIIIATFRDDAAGNADAMRFKLAEH